VFGFRLICRGPQDNLFALAVCAKLKLHDRAIELVAVRIVDLAQGCEFDVGRFTALTPAEFYVEDDGRHDTNSNLLHPAAIVVRGAPLLPLAY
jgi:hypothetical protein